MNDLTTQDPPEWAIKEACEAVGLRYDVFVRRDANEWALASIRAHARTIAEFKPGQADPLIEAVQGALGVCQDCMLVGEDFSEDKVDGAAFIAELRKRGVTIGGDA